MKHTFFAGELKAVAREDVRPGGQHRRFLREPVLIDPTEPATGYQRSGSATSADAAIYSSASDISVWDIGLAGEILVKDPALRKILYSPAPRRGRPAARCGSRPSTPSRSRDAAPSPATTS